MNSSAGSAPLPKPQINATPAWPPGRQARRTWLEAPRWPKCGPRARLHTNVPCRPRTRARGTPIGRPAARRHARPARSSPLLMRHRRASPTAPVRDSCDEWPDHARPAAPRAPHHRSLTASPTFCPRRCWLLHDGQPGCRTELRPVSTAGGQLHGTGRDALTAAAHARLLATKQHLDSRSSVRCSPPRPCEHHASRAFLTAPHPTPPQPALPGAPTRTDASTRAAAAAWRRAVRGAASLASTVRSALRSRRATLQPRCSATLQPRCSRRAAPRPSRASHAPRPCVEAHPLSPPPRSTSTRAAARAPLATTCGGAPRSPRCWPPSPSPSPRAASSPRRLRWPVLPSAR